MSWCVQKHLTQRTVLVQFFLVHWNVCTVCSSWWQRRIVVLELDESVSKERWMNIASERNVLHQPAREGKNIELEENITNSVRKNSMDRTVDNREGIECKELYKTVALELERKNSRKAKYWKKKSGARIPRVALVIPRRSQSGEFFELFCTIWMDMDMDTSDKTVSDGMDRKGSLANGSNAWKERLNEVSVQNKVRKLLNGHWYIGFVFNGTDTLVTVKNIECSG